uniref:serine hydrolase n=1 Tax=Nocardia brasiliensis TaxID=37326 RepID=UPI002457EC87
RVDALARAWFEELTQIVAAVAQGSGGHTTSDFPLTPIGQTEIDTLDTSVTSWDEVDEYLTGLVARVSLAAVEIEKDGHLRLVHGLDEDALRPTGSAFKLYVAATLGHEVALGNAEWNETLAIRDDWKSLPSGVLHKRPAGEHLTLLTYAEHMMAISDNTAADHLIHRLDRSRIQQTLKSLGHQKPEANFPFLTTRAMFHGKLRHDAGDVKRYLSAPRDERMALINGIEQLPLPSSDPDPDLLGWTEPTHIDEIEWFAAPSDICRVFAALRGMGQAEIDQVMAHDDAGLNLDAVEFPKVWSKAGSEPGVVALNYLVESNTKRAFVVSLMMSDPDGFDLPATISAGLQIVRTMFKLIVNE